MGKDKSSLQSNKGQEMKVIGFLISLSSMWFGCYFLDWILINKFDWAVFPTVITVIGFTVFGLVLFISAMEDKKAKQ